MNPSEKPQPGAQGDADPLQSLESKLYSPNVSREQIFPDARRGLTENLPPRDQGVAWEPIDIQKQDEMPQRIKTSKFIRGFFIVSLLFCLGAVGFALYYFFSDQLVISSKNIDINVSAPVRINGGEALPLSIEIANKNRQDLTDVHVTVMYPDDSRDPSSPDKTFIRDERDLPLIAGGSSQTLSSSALVYGEEQEEKKVLVRIEYGISSTQSRFSKEKEYAFLIDRSPLSVEVQHQEVIDAGQQAVFTLNITSNVEAPIADVLLVGTFPFNFSMQSAEPTAQDVNGNKVWALGTIRPGQKKTITVRGVMNGLEDEERSFRFVLGTEKEEADNEISTTLSAKTISVKVNRPSVGIAFDPESRTRDGAAVAAFGNAFRESFQVKNNLTQEISRPSVEMKVVGQYHEPLSPRGLGGFFRSSDQTLLWSGGNFLTLEPGEEKSYTMSFDIRDLNSFTTQLRNPSFEVVVTVRGTILDDRGQTKQIEVTSRQPIKFRTSMAAKKSVLYSGGPYRNSGPIPPRPDVPTMLTLRLEALNGINHISDAVARTTLPIYVDFVSVSPSYNVVYNEFSRSVTWTIGELPAYTGYGTSPQLAEMQLSITPSTSQRGTSPALTTPIIIEGTDRITGQQVRLELPAATIETIDTASGMKIQ